MAYHTRSGSSKSPVSDSDMLTAAEAEILRQQLTEKEKRLNKQADALALQQSELEKRKEEIEKKTDGQQLINMSELQDLMTSFRRELHVIRDLPYKFQELDTKMNTLQNPTFNANEQPKLKIPTAPLNPLNNTPVPLESSPIRLKDVADSIPKYDGQRISIYQFCTACERALNLISPNHEQHLVQLILSKLQGHAYIAVEGSVYTSVYQLLQRLKQIFGPNKSLNQYRGELGNAFMKPNESIFDYIARIKELKNAIIDCEAARATSCRYFDEWTIDNVEQEVLESFINGLPSDLHIRVRLDGYHGLDDAFVKTIQISKALEVERIRSKLNTLNKATSPLRQDIQPYNPKPTSSPDIQPRSILQRPQSPYIQPLIPGQPGPNAPPSFLCKYCKTPGHSINNCRKLAYKRTLEAQSQIPSGQYQDNSGNGIRVPVTNDVHRDAEQKGRQTLKTVQFQEPTSGSQPGTST